MKQVTIIFSMQRSPFCKWIVKLIHIHQVSIVHVDCDSQYDAGKFINFKLKNPLLLLASLGLTHPH